LTTLWTKMSRNSKNSNSKKCYTFQRKMSKIA
jgi:hypothetical protein